MSFRFCHYLYYVTSYFVVFDWKNLQNEQLYTLIPVPIICCTLTTKIFPFSDLHITLHMEQVHYWWPVKKCLLLPTTHSIRIIQPADGSQRTTAILKVHLRNEEPFQTESASETLEFDELWSVYSITLITMFVPTCTILVGDPLSGNGCGSPNHI